MNVFWSKFSLQAQIAILSAALLAIVISITAFINIQNLHAGLKDDLEKHGLALGKSLSSSLSYNLVQQDYVSMEVNLLNAAEFPEVESLKLIDTNGVILSHVIKTNSKEIRVSFGPPSDNRPKQLNNSKKPICLFNQDSLVIWYPLKTSRIVGWLNINISYAELKSLQSNVIRKNILAAIFIIFIDVIFLLLVLARPTKKIRHAIDVAQKLDAVHPPQTNEIGGSRELNQLFSALNGAAARLITQHQEIEVQSEKLRQSQAEAEAANQAKSQFLSSMSHELRTPLNAVIGFSQLFEYDTNLSEDQKKNARTIHQAGDHLSSLISEILDLASIESGQCKLILADINITTILEECEALIEPLAKSQDISIDIKVAQKEDVFIHADLTRLKQVLLNLMSNAVKYNNKGGHISIHCSLSNMDSIRINIQDTGIGIAEDKLKHLFQPFNRLGHEMKSTEGTGIGLVITKQLVDLMGGTMGVNSTLGKGSSFWIEFPIIK